MKKFLFLFIAMLCMSIAYAQGIGVGTTTPHSSAKLDISSTSQGFLPPRMTLAQRDNIQNPATGLIIWCTDCDELQVFNGVIWKNISGAAASTGSLPNVRICNQVWTIKNLDVTTYRNGDPIPLVTDPTEWAGLTTGAYCYYNNDSTTYAATYGKLYNWYAVNDPRGLAPLGFHIPSNTELTALVDCLGDIIFVGGKMKAVSSLWNNPNAGANNVSGFTGLPGGIRLSSGVFSMNGFIFHGWSSTETNVGSAWRYILYHDTSQFAYDEFGDKKTGMSVRCIKD
jgi:uncharacterized protein (TIGR02145 family)